MENTLLLSTVFRVSQILDFSGVVLNSMAFLKKSSAREPSRARRSKREGVKQISRETVEKCKIQLSVPLQ